MSPTVLGLVPARSGSKGIPDKNAKALAGKPLLTYAVEAAEASGAIDRLVLSTDSPEIADIGRKCGLEVPFMRPSELARDDTPMLPVVQQAVQSLEQSGWSCEVIVILQPTAPLRSPHHIRRSLELLEQTGGSSVVSVVEIPAHHSPQYAMRIEGERLLSFLPEGERITRRQDVEPAYFRDGTVYAVRKDVVMDEASLYGPDCRPLVLAAGESITLDTPEDWALAEARLKP